MRVVIPVVLVLALLTAVTLVQGIGEAGADQREDCYTLDRSRPEWGGSSSAIEDPDLVDPDPIPVILGVHPNPFSIGTTLGFEAPAGARRATVRIFDLTGRVLRVLETPIAAPGAYQLSWDRLDQEGRRVPPGICFYRIESGDTQITGRLVLID